MPDPESLPPHETEEEFEVRNPGAPNDQDSEMPAAQQLEYLVLRCQRGERGAWRDLLQNFEAPLYYYARRMTGDPELAGQVLQDTWVAALGSLHGLQDAARLAPWLYTLARRSLLRRLRGGSLRPADQEPTTLPDPAPGPDQAFDDAEAVHWGLEQLAPAPREVLVLFFLEDLRVQQIAEVLGIPEGTVKSRLFRARQQLAAVLRSTECDS